MHRATISLAIDFALLQAVEDAAKQAGVTRSALIRHCVRDTLDRKDVLAVAGKVAAASGNDAGVQP